MLTYYFLQSQYRFVCECICAAYMKMSRNSALLAQGDEDEEDEVDIND